MKKYWRFWAVTQALVIAAGAFFMLYGSQRWLFFVGERQVGAWHSESRALQLRLAGIRPGSLQPFQKLIRKFGIQSQLKDVSKLLKLDAGNTDLMAQKQKLLTQAISETQEKLDVLKGRYGQGFEV